MGRHARALNILTPHPICTRTAQVHDAHVHMSNYYGIDISTTVSVWRVRLLSEPKSIEEPSHTTERKVIRREVGSSKRVVEVSRKGLGTLKVSTSLCYNRSWGVGDAYTPDGPPRKVGGVLGSF